MENKTKFIIFVVFLSLIFLNTSFLNFHLNAQKSSLSKKEFSLNIADNYIISKWGWMSGNNTKNVNGVYGTIGVPDTANYPGSREGSASWSDLNGNLWLFGGIGYPASGSGWLNDLWRYNITSEMWTWMSGDNFEDHFGVYGTKGVPNAANYPGSREYSSTWTDIDGNLWLFGGWGFDSVFGNTGYLNDLWRYNVTSGMWTWMSGNDTINEWGVYGTKKVPNIANYPGSREFSSSWIDIDANLWLFGGYGYDASGSLAYLNDLWRYNLTSEIWTWMSGNDTVDEWGVYGTKGVPSVANYPGSRRSSVNWVDLDGNLWLFGGYGYNASAGIGFLNDLWRYNVTSKMWTWMLGNNTRNVFGLYGTKGIANMANYPGSRRSSVSWIDLDGNLWLFGGFGYAALSGGNLNDLWRYNVTSKMWTWMSGKDTIDEYGEYGAKRIPDSTNYPGCRKSSVSWTDLEGCLWLFGGDGYSASDLGRLNDLWRFELEMSSSPVNPPVVFPPDDDDDDDDSTQKAIPGFNLLIISIVSGLSIIGLIKMINKKKLNNFIFF